MPAPRPPGVTITRLPSTSGDSLSSQFGLSPSELLEDVALPDDCSVRGAQAGEIAALGQHVDAIAVDGRRAARPRAAIVVASRTEDAHPDRLAVGAIEARDHALPIAHPLHVDAVALHGDRAVAGAEHRPPTRPPAVPIAATALEQAGLLRDARSIGSAPLRPVNGRRLACSAMSVRGSTPGDGNCDTAQRRRMATSHFRT